MNSVIHISLSVAAAEFIFAIGLLYVAIQTGRTLRLKWYNGLVLTAGIIFLKRTLEFYASFPSTEYDLVIRQLTLIYFPFVIKTFLIIACLQIAVQFKLTENKLT